MLSYISSWFNYLFSSVSNEETDDYKEDYLAEQLVDLEYIVRQEEKSEKPINTPQIPNDAICFKKTGNTYDFILSENISIDIKIR